MGTLKLIGSETSDRNITLFDKSLGVIRNGEDNLYPTRIERTINSSITAISSASMYGKFMMGHGFSVNMEDFIIGKTKNKKLTPNKLLQAITNDLKKHQGCFIHCNYNANFKISSVSVIPYRYCRLGQADDVNYSGKIVVYNNWDKSISNRMEKSKFKAFDTFNPNPEVVAYQVEKAGGFNKYLGQIYFLSMDDSSIYPLSLIDVCLEDAESEYNFAVFRNTTITGGFFAPIVMRHSKFEDKKDKQAFIEKVQNLKGARNADKILLLEDEFTSDNKDGGLRIDKVDLNYNDKTFGTWPADVSNNIRKAFKNIPVVLVDYEQGKLGNTSGESFYAAQNFYNSVTSEERMTIEMAIKSIFSNFYMDINPAKDWSIKPLEILKKEIAVDAQAAALQQSQAQLRGSVGGVTALLAVQTSVSAGTTTYESGVAMLKYIYGYQDAVAREILGQPKTIEDAGAVNQ